MVSSKIVKEHRVPRLDTTIKVSNVMSNIHWNPSTGTNPSLKRPLDITQGRPDDMVRKKQIIQGKFRNGPNQKLNLLLIAELWPSIILGYNLPTFDSNIWVVCPSCDEMLKALLPPYIQWIGHMVASALVRASRCNWIIVQGSIDYVGKIVNTWCNPSTSEDVKLLVIVPAKRYRISTGFLSRIQCWKNVSHSLLGGVTTSRWKIGIWSTDNSWRAFDLHEVCKAYGLVRKFMDIISHVESGRVAQRPDKSLPDLFPWHESQFRREFILPSVFSSTQFASRKLVMKELSGLLDLSDELINEFYEQGITGADEFLTLYHQDTPPLKMSQLVLNITMMTSAASVASSEKSVQRPSALPYHSDNNALIVDPEKLNEVEGEGIASTVEEYLQEYGQKAAKDDDAGVPVMLWNNFIFSHGCLKGTTCSVRKIAALETIRSKFAFVYYKKNLLRSFLRYMQLEHGNEWLNKIWLTKLEKSNRKRKRRDGLEVAGIMSDKVFYEASRDLKVGIDGLTRAFNSSWWEWLDGSSCFFWRWPKPIRRQVRDGVDIFVQGKLPRWRKKQKLPSKNYMVEKMNEKLYKVVNRRYLLESTVLSLINCFAVEKGETDIRLVYDGTKSGLNSCIFAPNFFLPSIDSMLMTVDVNSWFDDHDLGEMFLNYFLNKSLQKYSGVDLTANLRSPKSDWRAWGRMFMGFTASPYVTCKLFGWCMDVIFGNRWDPDNPFRWDEVRANLPGSKIYNPSGPRLCKTWKGDIAATIEAYVDDIRGIGHSEVNCKRAGARAAQIIQYFGQQDAARKYRPPHKRPGPWCGSFVGIRDQCVWVYTSQEKWEKASTFINELAGVLERGEKINHKFLERGRGFMVYFCRTYTTMTPFLKGMNLTLDWWRKGRDGDGWKLRGKEIDEYGGNFSLEVETSSTDESDVDDWEDLGSGYVELGAGEPLAPILLDCIEVSGNDKQGILELPPESVPGVPRMLSDVNVLRSFLQAEKAPWRFVRGSRIGVVQYGFADAAKSGFGATIQEGSGGLWYRLGVWSCSEANESSNYRELANLVESLEERITTSDAKGMELFIFTDNSTAEAAFYKGTSTSKKLFELIVRLKRLEVEHCCLIHFVHIAGTRMITQGTDGLSRGDFNTGVMRGEGMLSFIPLHLSPLEREENLEPWIREVVTPSAGETEILFLNYADWFQRGHDIIGGELNGDGVWTPIYESGTYIWTPPPSAALIAVEQLRRARLKRECSTHVFIVPKIMSPEWQRQLFRVSDLYIELPFVKNVWDKTQHHEPLIFAVIFPFLSHRPWQLKRTGAFLGMGRLLRSMFKADKIPPGSILRKLFMQQRRLASLQEGVVRKMLHSPGEFGFLHAQ